MTEPAGEMSAVKRALVEIRDLRARLARAESAAREPIAVIGLGCRFPGGVTGPEELWSLLESGTDAVGPVPDDRWDRDGLYHPDPDHPGTMVTTQGGFIAGVDRFDAEFFGIAPIEAASMDPQQRLLLEVAWEALERAGIAPDALRGSPTGVFIGIGNSDYWRMMFSARDRLDAYAGSGGSYAVTAGRLAYTLGLQGPAMAIDTACSASLVAIHNACQSLRSGESNLALAGGVNLILSPEAHIAFSKARMMAPDGRCKTFDASADGYGRGEGCGIVVLRRLSDAVAGGDRILAVVRGSALNQDGRSGGLTVPNGPAQVAVIRAALAMGGLAPADVDLVEAHGTGTPLGDPIELGALATAYGEGRSADRRLLVSSLKTNFGHLEAAAGIAGFIKAVLAVERGTVPAHLHFRTPSPHVDWAALPVRVPAVSEPWPEVGSRPRRVGVSSFGFSGTNAHVIVEQAPAVDQPAVPPSRWVLSGSARSEAALAQLAAQYADAVAGSDDGGASLAVVSGVGRAALRHRFALPMAEPGTLIDSLRTLAEGGRPSLGHVGAVTPGQSPRIAFLFSGQGSQYAGMGAELYRTEQVFQAAVDRAIRAAGEIGPTVLGALLGSPGIDAVEPRIAQPALLTLQYGLLELWRSWGVEPALVAGHSLGEFAAAVAAGVLDIEIAMSIVRIRGRMMQALPAGGGMLVVETGEQGVQGVLQRFPELELSAVNGTAQAVVGGPLDTIAAATEALQAEGIRARPLALSHAYHTSAMDPMLEEFVAAIGSYGVSRPLLPVVSSLTGIEADATFATPSYWASQIRSTVRFSNALGKVLDAGATHLIEIGPHPVLLSLAADRAGVTPLPSLRRETPVWPVLLDGVAALFVDGVPVRWRNVQSGGAWRPDTAPTYPFERRRYWIDAVDADARYSSAQRWDAVVAAAQRQSEQAPLRYRADTIGETWASLARLTWAHAAETFRRLGAFDDAPLGRSVDEVVERTGIKPLYRHLIERWLERLVDTGRLERVGPRYRPAGGSLAAVSLGPVWQEAQGRLASDPALLTYLEGCGRLLPAVLTGEVSPLETLFPNGSSTLAEALYAETGVMRYVNLIAAAAIEAAASRTRSGRLRVLEIGAGTGGTTVAVAPRLDPERTDYWFTDVSDLFLARASERFGTASQFRYATLDLDRDPFDQGFTVDSFDIVLATNAVHATKDLRASLRRIHDLLAPGGVLVLVESTEHLDWFDMSTGLIEGWQHFEDDLRGDNPLLEPAQWRGALGAAGFAAVVVAPEDDSPASAGGQRVILARKPGEDVPTRIDQDAPGQARVAGKPVPAVDPAASLLEMLRDAPSDERESILIGFVRDHVMRTLRLAPDAEPGRTDRLLDIGFDSLMAVQFRNALGAGLGLDAPLSATLLFDHPTIEAIARFLLGRLGLAASPAAAPVSASEPGAALSEADLAAMTDDEVAIFLERRLGEGT